VPESSTSQSGPSLEQILWRAVDRFREEPALLDAEEFADHIAHAFDARVPEEAFCDHFFADGEGIHPPPADLAEAVVRAAKRRLHVYEFDLSHLEYVIVEDKDEIVVVSDFGQFQLRNDDVLSRVLEAAVVKSPERGAGQPRGYLVRASGELVGVDVNKIARTLERHMVRQVSMPAVMAPGRRLAPFNPVRKALSEQREERALREDPRMSRPLPPAPASAPRASRPETGEAALFVVMPDGSVARIGSASKWEQMLGRYAQVAGRNVAVQTANAIAIVAGSREDRPGERAEARSQALVAVRSDWAPVRALAEDDLARALSEGGRLLPAVSEDRFWVQPERAFRPDPPPPEKTVVAQPLQLGEITGDPWADWALLAGGARARPAASAIETDPSLIPPALRERLRSVHPQPLQLAGAPVAAFRAPDGGVIVNRAGGAIRLASLDRPDGAASMERPVALRQRADWLPRAGAVPVAALEALRNALERTAAAGGYRLPFMGLSSAHDATETGDALRLDAGDERRRSVRLAGPASLAGRTGQLVLSMPFPNRGELHVGEDLSDALQAWLEGPVLPAPSPATTSQPRDVSIAARPVATARTGPDFEALHQQAAGSAKRALLTLDLTDLPPPAHGGPSMSDLPVLLRQAVAQSGDWTPGPGAGLPLAVRDFALTAPYVASAETSPLRQAPAVQLRPPSPGEEEIVIPLPLWAQMGRGAVGETDRIMASPIAPRGYRPPLGAYRLVVPGGGPLDLTGGAPAHAEDVVALSGPTALRVERSLAGGVAATTPSGRHFLGRVLLDEPGPRDTDTTRKRIRIGAPVRGPGSPEATTASGGRARPAHSQVGSVPAPGRDEVAIPGTAPAAAAGRHAPLEGPRAATPGAMERSGPRLPSAAATPPVDEPRDLPAVARPFSMSSVVTGLEPGMWSGHRPQSTASYRRWTYAWSYLDEPQVVGGVLVSGLRGARYPQLPSVLRFRYAGAPLWWAAPKTDAPLDPEEESSRGGRAMRAGLRAANSAAAIWRSILIAGAAQEDATGGMDTGREASAEAMSSVARSLDVLQAPLAAAASPPVPGSAGPAYIAMSGSGAAGAVSSATAAVKAHAQARAQSVEMSIVAAIPPAPPPLESMSSVARGAEAPRARGAGRAQDAAQGHKELDDAVSHSKIEGSVDAIAQRIYHRIRRRIESDRERFGG
jgi:hypothetical protein